MDPLEQRNGSRPGTSGSDRGVGGGGGGGNDSVGGGGGRSSSFGRTGGGAVNASLGFGDPPPRPKPRQSKKKMPISKNDWRNGGTLGLRHKMNMEDPDDAADDEPVKLPPAKGASKTPPRTPTKSLAPFTIPALANRSAAGFTQNPSPKAHATATFPQERFNLTPRKYCLEAGRERGTRGGYVAASRAFANALVHAPKDQHVAQEFKRGLHDIAAARPFFLSPHRRPRQFAHGHGRIRTPPEPEHAPSSEDEWDDGPQRKRKANKEFGELWMRLSRDVKVGCCRFTPGTPWFSQLTPRLLSGTFSA